MARNTLVLPLKIVKYSTLNNAFLSTIFPHAADPADRVTPTHQPVMLLECMEEGTIRWDESIDEHQWLEIGAALGEIIDEDDDDTDKNWEWQAYLHDEEG